ncbi:hypothetical protein BGZ74_005316 [Mortierella antarctica]|nr:hypothetical protein BGZ74_005316 [Mortierella antarctica]
MEVRSKHGRRSGITQMLPRQRRWEPVPLDRFSAHRSRQERGSYKNIDDSVRFIDAVFPDDPFPDDLLVDVLKEATKHDFELNQYDPYQGNVCVTGQYLGLPVIATPTGPTAASLAITLAQHKPNQKPPYNLLAPRTDLITFPSAISQIAMPFCGSDAVFEERVLVRTKDYVTIISPPAKAPAAISRIAPDFLEVVDQVPCRSPSLWKDDTVHAAISPHLSNQYALIGDRGSIAIWTTPRNNVAQDSQSESSSASGSNDSDDDADDGRIGTRRKKQLIRQKIHQETEVKVPGVMTTNRCYNPASSIVVVRQADMTSTPEDPWRSCRWDAHPSQLVVASRKDVSLVDIRKREGQRCLFEAQSDEVVRAIQETEYSVVAPFQTYIVTSHQVACLDHRFTKRPLLSWAHHSDREQPCGIKCMDVDFGPDRYSTVVTWTRRNADITAYNVTRSNENPQPLQLMGRAQGLGSFHSHAQYTNTSALRDSTSRYRFQTDDQGRLAQGIKPPLFGLDLLPSAVLEVDKEDEEIDDDTRHQKLRNSKKFSVIQYSYTGAVYAQEFEMLKTSELDSGRRLRVTRESILSSEYHDDQPSLSSSTVSADGNILVSDLTHQLNTGEQDLDPLDLMDQIVHATDGLCAPWKHGAKAAQSIADNPPLNPLEVRRHEDLDLTSFIKKLETYLKTDFERSSRSREIEMQQKLEEAQAYDVLEKIKADHLPMSDRETISQRIQEYIEHTPYLLHGVDYVHQKIIRTPLLPDSKLGELLEEKEPSQERIAEALEDMYPLPATRDIALRNPQESTDSISASLANLSIPGTRSSITTGFESVVDDQEDDGTQIWPTIEIQQARSQIIQRLSQNLYLSTITIFREPELDPEPATQSGERPKPKEVNLRYLVQESKDAKKVRIPAVSVAILDEWEEDQDPSKYVYMPPPSSKAAQDTDDEPDEEEIRKHEEHLLKLRKRREQRASYKVPSISTKGSASQPAMADGGLSGSQAFIPDEDGMFSLPTVISASQPTAVSSQPKPKPKPKTKHKSIPSAIESLSQRSKTEEVPNRFSTQTPLFMDDSMFTASFASSSQDWEITLPLSQELPFSQGPVFFGAGGNSTSGGSVGMSFGGATHDDRQGGMMVSTQQPASPTWESADMSGSQEMASVWMGASQPVPGAFATRRPINTQKKKKKKKISTQGF